MTAPCILAIDQGTTSTRAILFDGAGSALATSARELTQHYPQPGWVEHDSEEIWQSVGQVVGEVLQAAGVPTGQVAAIGITNQRETAVLWDRRTSAPAAPAIVWQDRRTADFCRERRADEPWLTAKTGLVLDPYFSATKIHWLLDQEPLRRHLAESGSLAMGTVDAFLIWRLTGGSVHATDVTNASRTLLLNIETGQWDQELCKYFGVPEALLPEVRPSAGDFGQTSGLKFLPDGIPILGVAGDQQAALFGQRGFGPGEAKCTYGTGAFFLQHLGAKPVASKHRLLCTMAAAVDERLQYALEGSVFVAGAAVQWLRDGLKLIQSAGEIEQAAQQADPEQEVVFVPALVGLGAPYWSPEARGAIFGLTRGTTVSELAQAALQGVAFQVADLIEAAEQDATGRLQYLKVDGGMARNRLLMQFQADILGLPVLAAVESQSTALGAAFLAGLRAGVWKDLDALRHLPLATKCFEPRMPQERRGALLHHWRKAVQATLSMYSQQR